jgi:hypothetical protein
MSTPTSFTKDQIDFAAAVALLAAQQTSNGLGLPRSAQRPWVAGDESDEQLEAMADSLQASHPGNAQAACLIHDMAIYRLVRTTTPPTCPQLAARRAQYISRMADGGW